MSKNDRSRPIPTRSLSRAPNKRALLPKAIALAVASCFVADLAIANPSGMSVVSGNVTPNRNGNLLTLTNTPGAIINWQSFSIGANEITRFIQQSAASSVLNKVKGGDPSQILGALQSQLANGVTAGRVFLINPNGIMFGAGARVDVGGLVASTLDLSDSDFLANRLRFTEVPGMGAITNHGVIATPTGGQVYLIAPNVQNTGLITSPQGQVVLAAGRSVELVDSATPNLRVEISAPDNEAVNVGQIIANSGKIGIYSGLIRNSGVVRADGVVQGANGEILLKATNVALEAGGVLSASGTSNGIGGGTISVAAGTITNAGTVQANAADNASAGNISMVAQDMLTLTRTSRVEVKGADINSNGGTFYLYSHGDATANSGQVMDLSGGATSGNGGSGEFSATNNAAFAGSVFGATQPGYRRSSFIFDPFDGTLGAPGETATIGSDTTSFAQNNITIAGEISLSPGVTLKLLADHNTESIDSWHDGVGAILNPGGFTITAADNTNNLVMFAAGGGIGTSGAPVRTEMNGGNLAVFTNNPNQVDAAPTFVTNGASAINIARLTDRFVVLDENEEPVSVSNNNSFRIISGGNITQSAVELDPLTQPQLAGTLTGLITVNQLAVNSTGGTVNLPLENLVDVLAGGSDAGCCDGSFIFNNAKALTIGTVAGLSGITVNGDFSATVNVTTSVGDLTVNDEVTATSSEGNATIILTSAAGLAANAGVIADGNGDARIELTANSGNLTTNHVEAIANDNADVVLTANDGGSITVNGEATIIADAGNNATIELTTNDGGSIIVNAMISADAGNDASITLNSSGSITINGGGSVSASANNNATVTMTSATSMTVNGPVSVDGGEGGGEGTITLTANSGGLTTNATINADGGEGASVTLIAKGGGALNVNDTVEAASSFNDATVSLITNNGGSITVTGDGTVRADADDDATVNLTTVDGGNITVNDHIQAIAFGDANVNVTANFGGIITANSLIEASSEFGSANVNVTTNGGGTINLNSTVSASSETANANVDVTANNGGLVNLTSLDTINAFAGLVATVAVNGDGGIALGANINADGAEGATISLTALNGGITRTANVELSAQGDFNFSEINLEAANGIGNFGSPIQVALGTNPSIEAFNNSSGNIVLSQAVGNMQADVIENFAPGGAVDLTAVSGGINGGFISSQGALTLRSTVAEGFINILGGAEGAGVVTFIGDNMDFLGSVSSGANVINLRTHTAGRNIVLGGVDGGELGFSQTDINNANGFDGVFVGEQVARNNPITFVAPTTIDGTVNLFGSSVTQVAEAGITGGLVVGVGAGDVTLTEGTNAINRFATSGAVTGNVNLTTTSNLALGLVQATGAVNVTSGGAITDGNPFGADVIASSVALTAVNGIGTLADPLETQVGSPLSLISSSGSIGVINTGNVELSLQLSEGNDIAFLNFGNVRLDSLVFNGISAVVEASGTLTTNSGIEVTATDHLALLGNSGLMVRHGIAVGIGDLILNGGAGDLYIGSPTNGFTVSARNIALQANNINVTGVDGGEGGATIVHAAQNMNIVAFNDLNVTGGAANNSPVEIRNDEGLFTVFTGNDVNVRGGSGSNSHALMFGSPDVDMSACLFEGGPCGIGGVVRIDEGGPGSFARIEAQSADTISLLLRNCSSGCFFVNGVEGVVLVGDATTGSGFVAGGLPGFGGSGGPTFGIPIPGGGDDDGGGFSDTTIEQALATTAGEINSAADPLLKQDKEPTEDEELPAGMCTP